jgi:pyrroloquinoline quinone (PQQ) biosynthesis protein C
MTDASPSVGHSWAYLYQGSAEAFVDALCADARAHPAVNHPYLQRLASGDLPDVPAAIRDYCHQYFFYSGGFTRYLEAAINGLQSPAHREVLRQNLAEERGEADPANPQGLPHTVLFQRFRRAAGVSPAFEAETPPSTTVCVWRDLFLQKCQSAQPGVGVGAIGIGTELVVSSIYRYLYEAVTRHTALSAEDCLFLTLHLDCDDQHAEALRQVSVELAAEPGLREALRFGALSSLNLRQAFWDVMLARALAR